MFNVLSNCKWEEAIISKTIVSLIWQENIIIATIPLQTLGSMNYQHDTPISSASLHVACFSCNAKLPLNHLVWDSQKTRLACMLYGLEKHILNSELFDCLLAREK